MPFSCWRALLAGGGGSGCLPGSCLSVASTFPSPPLNSSFPPFFLPHTPSSPSPSFRCVLSRLLTQHSVAHEVGGCGGLVVPTVTGRLWGGGSAAPIGVALQTLLYHV